MLDELQEFRVLNGIVKQPGENVFLFRCTICDKTIEILQVVNHVVGRSHLKNRIAKRNSDQFGQRQAVERPVEAVDKQEGEFERSVGSEISELVKSKNEPGETSDTLQSPSDAIKPPLDTEGIGKKKIKQAKKIKLQRLVDELGHLMELNRIVKEREGDNEFMYRCLICEVTVTLPAVPQHVEGRTHLKKRSDTSGQVKHKFDGGSVECTKRTKTE